MFLKNAKSNKPAANSFVAGTKFSQSHGVLLKGFLLWCLGFRLAGMAKSQADQVVYPTLFPIL